MCMFHEQLDTQYKIILKKKKLAAIQNPGHINKELDVFNSLITNLQLKSQLQQKQKREATSQNSIPDSNQTTP